MFPSSIVRVASSLLPSDPTSAANITRPPTATRRAWLVHASTARDHSLLACLLASWARHEAKRDASRKQSRILERNSQETEP